MMPSAGVIRVRPLGQASWAWLIRDADDKASEDSLALLSQAVATIREKKTTRRLLIGPHGVVHG